MSYELSSQYTSEDEDDGRTGTENLGFDPAENDDLQLLPRTFLTSKIGSWSMERIRLQQETDRVSSEVVNDELRFGDGSAPSTMYQQVLWVRRFAYWRRHTKRQDLSLPFNHRDLIGFLNSMLRELDTRQSAHVFSFLTIPHRWSKNEAAQ